MRIVAVDTETIRGNGHENICIAFRDKYSKNLVEVSISLEDFAKALTGQGFVDCEYEFIGEYKDKGFAID